MMLKYFCIGILLLPLQVYSQADIIEIENPSLEGLPKIGSNLLEFDLPGWEACRLIDKEKQSPPDIHPGGFFNVVKKPQHKDTYVGLVTRENGTWESISQELKVKLTQDKCYKVSVHLSRSDKYVNKQLAPEPGNGRLLKDIKRITKPVIFALLGGQEACDGELLAQTGPVAHTEWKKYTFIFNAQSEYSHLVLSAIYDPEADDFYNGNLLIDNLSVLTVVPCPE